MNCIKILIIDDNEAIAGLIKDILVSVYKFRVDTSGDVMEAEKKIKAGLKPDVVLLDYQLKESTTENFATWLKAINPNVIIVMISGEARKSRKLQQLENEGISNGYMAKPFSARDVAEVIRSLEASSVRADRY